MGGFTRSDGCSCVCIFSRGGIVMAVVIASMVVLAAVVVISSAEVAATAVL